MTVVLERIDLGSENGDLRGDPARVAGGKINRNAEKVQVALDAMTGLGLVKGSTTTLPAGSSFDFSLSGPGPVYVLDMAVPAGPAGAGAPTSKDILAIAEMGRLERSLAAAGVPDEASLTLDFIRGVHFASKTAIAASIVALIAALPGSSFTRASTGTFWDSDGLLKTAANNVPRIDYDPVTRALRGLLNESQARTNLRTYSAQLDQSAYTKFNASVTVDAMVAPTGLGEADVLVEDASNSTHAIFGNTTAYTAGTAYSASVFVKRANGSRNLRISFDAAAFDGNGRVALFDLGAGSVLSAQPGVTAAIQPVGNGWFRASISATANASANGSLQFYMADLSAITYPGDGVSSLGLWGVQLEAGAAPSSYIPTVASTVTRAADAPTLAAAQWLAAGGGSIVVETARSEGAISGALATVALDDGATNNMIYLRSTSSLSPRLEVLTGGVSQAVIDGPVIPVGARSRTAAAWAANDFCASTDGALAVTDNSGAVPAGLTRMLIGRSAAGNGFMGHICRILFFPHRLSNVKVQALSGNAWS